MYVVSYPTRYVLVVRLDEANLPTHLWFVADLGDEICVSLSGILYSLILVDFYHCLSYKHAHVSYMSPCYVSPCIVSSFDLEFGHIP
jgi:hypothetical protein